uniref:Retrovirus-related Pol polyprotein from transposon TNT 1-94 n=1 Tax=Tanacetum cinerariifolium TaxID=118510 RepID=A0A6L2P724_TANCI|nr:retrovirus-related Pol polyprotein from transposon TNT 1-94 [Tanacetum cinerariifolium]
MAQLQRQADVHQDKLYPPNKRYALMDANKKIDLDNPLCPNESKILANILQNHPLRFSIVASSSVPWIYLGQFLHTLKEDGSKYRLTFVLDIKELTMTLDDFQTIFQLPQATYNNHERFVAAPKFSEMVPFFINDLGFTLELRSLSNFMTIGLVQPWQTLCKMFSRCLTTRVTSYDQPPLQIMQMLYCFINNLHVDYADLLCEGLHYSLEHPSILIHNPRFTKLIIIHYMTAFPEISRRARDKYHNLEHDEMVKSIFNSGKNKAGMFLQLSHNRLSLPRERIGQLAPLGNDEVDNSISDSQNDHGTRLELMSYKEIPKGKGKNVEESRHTPSPITIRSPMIHSTLISSNTKKLQELTTRFLARKKFNVLAQHLPEVMEEALPKMVDDHEERENLQADISSQINNAITNHIPSQVDSSVRNYMSGNQEQLADFDFWTNSYAIDDDELPTEKVSQELVEEMSQTVDEVNYAKLLMKYKCVKKFNLYARYNVEHWKNPHAKIFHIKRQKELGKLKEEVYLNLKIVQIIKTYGELGHEHKFITVIIERRANGSTMSITKPDYKNLNKNDIEDMYLLIVNNKLGVESYQQKVNLTAPTITFPGIEKRKMFSIVFELVYGIIYNNSKKEKRVMRHQEIHNFCDATLKRVLEGLKSYNNNVKHCYVTPSLSKEEAEYLQLFEEEIEERLKHRDQIRR